MELGDLRRILVVDDFPGCADSICHCLRTRGYDCLAATSARDALAAVDAFAPDVAILDLDLPDTDGCTLARMLRMRPVTSDVHLVALSGWDRREHRERARAAGFLLYVVKPIAPRRLVDMILAAVGYTGNG